MKSYTSVARFLGELQKARFLHLPSSGLRSVPNIITSVFWMTMKRKILLFVSLSFELIMIKYFIIIYCGEKKKKKKDLPVPMVLRRKIQTLGSV